MHYFEAYVNSVQVVGLILPPKSDRRFATAAVQGAPWNGRRSRPPPPPPPLVNYVNPLTIPGTSLQLNNLCMLLSNHCTDFWTCTFLGGFCNTLGMLLQTSSRISSQALKDS